MNILGSLFWKIRSSKLPLMLFVSMCVGVAIECETVCAQDGPPAFEPGLHSRSLNNFPTRLALGHTGLIYVSDAFADAVFIYDATVNPVDQIRGLDCPLGIAVSSDGKIYVGNDGCDNVCVYTSEGIKTQVIGAGTCLMPNDLALDRDDRLYVADSLSDKVWVYDVNGCPVNSINVPAFPIALTVAYRPLDNTEIGELFVAEQRYGSIKVFDLNGSHLRTYSEKIKPGTKNSHGTFVRIQSLVADAYGRLHVADCFLNNVQILDAVTGEFISTYGEYGREPGQLNLPLDLLIRDNDVIVSNAGNRRIEIIYALP